MNFYPTLENYISKLSTESKKVSNERKQILFDLAQGISTDLKTQKKSSITFICTHNSRRSHFAHIWAASLAAFFWIEQVQCYSGGTEATALHQNTVAALRRAGFRINLSSDEQEYNPKYILSYSDECKPEQCYSKVYNEAPNPSTAFRAVMTCSEADENCPIVYGASARHSLTYEDPKISDNTVKETLTYDQRCLQIATELWIVMRHLSEQHSSDK